MENLQEVKNDLVEQIKSKNIKYPKVEMVTNTKTWDELKNVISEIITWCEDYNIIVPDGEYKNKEKVFTVLNGKRHGKYTQYHHNGKVEVECDYLHGKRHGEYTRYHSNGKVHVKFDYLNGVVSY